MVLSHPGAYLTAHVDAVFDLQQIRACRMERSGQWRTERPVVIISTKRTTLIIIMRSFRTRLNDQQNVIKARFCILNSSTYLTPCKLSLSVLSPRFLSSRTQLSTGRARPTAAQALASQPQRARAGAELRTLAFAQAIQTTFAAAPRPVGVAEHASSAILARVETPKVVG